MHLDAPMGMRPDEPEPAPCDDSTTLHSAGQEDALHFKEQKAIIAEVIMQSSNGSGKSVHRSVDAWTCVESVFSSMHTVTPRQHSCWMLCSFVREPNVRHVQPLCRSERATNRH